MQRDKSIIKDALKIPVKEFPCLLLVIFFFFVLGGTSGIASMKSLADLMGTNYLLDSVHTSSIDILNGFIHQLLLNTALYFMIVLAGIWMPGILLTTAGIILKGFILGAGSMGLMRCANTTDTIGILLCILLPESATVILMMNFARKSFQEWLSRAKTYFTGNRLILATTYLKGIYAGFKALILLVSAGYFISCGGLHVLNLMFDAATGK